MVGAGGLGSAALPYLAGAGIGHITIVDDDQISLHNLHRQTIFQNAEIGQPKAEAAARYIQALNPDICVDYIHLRIQETVQNIEWSGIDLILDGSDNFETKTALNDLSLTHHIPLITASVNQYQAQCGIFAGYQSDAPCYACLFPALPQDARNCNEAGVLGTAAGLAGLYQAHLAIMFLAGFSDIDAGLWLQCDFKSLRVQKISVPKNKNCTLCHNKIKPEQPKAQRETTAMIDILHYAELMPKNPLIVDVRTAGEIESDPIEGAVHIELSQIPARHIELPKDRLLAFVCAGNIRSVKAAEYLAALGYQNVCVLDKFSL